MTKKIVYLFGAGATQGVVSYHDPNVSVLTSDIVENIQLKISKEKIKELYPIRGELQEKNIEDLITLYESTGSNEHLKIAVKLKSLFRFEILKKLKPITSTKGFKPTLFCSLIDMHNIPKINEEIKAIISLNYDDLFERALRTLRKEINYSIYFVPHNQKAIVNNSFPFIKLHGSFDWKKDFPLRYSSPDKINDNEIAWVPPGATKRRDFYPFDLLWGTTKEIIDFDILRIVGCALTRNDWHVASLVFNFQKSIYGKKIKIEIIDFDAVGKQIRTNYPFFDVITILENTEFTDYLTDYYAPIPLEKIVLMNL